MTKDVKETKEGLAEKEPRDKSESTGSCGCGCIPPVETK